MSARVGFCGACRSAPDCSWRSPACRSMDGTPSSAASRITSCEPAIETLCLLACPARDGRPTPKKIAKCCPPCSASSRVRRRASCLRRTSKRTSKRFNRSAAATRQRKWCLALLATMAMRNGCSVHPERSPPARQPRPYWASSCNDARKTSISPTRCDSSSSSRSNAVARPDFTEGVRALLIDKDNKPQWQPRTLAEVTPQWIDGHFAAPVWPDSKHPLADL